MNREELTAAYRRRAEHDAAIAEEFEGVSSEADELLGEIPEWEEKDEAEDADD